MILSETGKIARNCWLEIPDHFSFVKLDEFVVMPDHFHGIISIEKKSINIGPGPHADPDIPDPEEPGSVIITPGQKRFRNPGKNNISSIVGSFKSAVSRLARKVDPNFGWQSRFHDHIIRDEKDFKKIERYIKFNPKNWKGETLSQIIEA
jgi:REP element-mobilizing transposase RayT